jgi:hypothetical protein
MIRYDVVLYYIILYYAMLCYAMLCYVMLCYVMLCFVMLCYVMLCYVMLYIHLNSSPALWDNFSPSVHPVTNRPLHLHSLSHPLPVSTLSATTTILTIHHCSHYSLYNPRTRVTCFILDSYSRRWERKVVPKRR